MLCFQSDRRRAQGLPAALPDRAIVRRTAPIRVTCSCFFLWAACAAWCQVRPSADLLRGLQPDGLNSAEVQQQERTRNSLPDAPSSMQSPQVALTFSTAVDEARPPLTVGASLLREAELRYFTPGSQPGRLTARYQVAFIRDEPSLFPGKYLHRSVLELRPHYHPSTSDSFVGRASYAASRIFVTHDGSGKERLNTTYFLGLLASVAAHSASNRNSRRTTLARVNSFGSTVGSDAGISVFHEFGPGLRQIVKGHTPKFVSSVEDRFSGK